MGGFGGPGGFQGGQRPMQQQPQMPNNGGGMFNALRNLPALAGQQGMGRNLPTPPGQQQGPNLQSLNPAMLQSLMNGAKNGNTGFAGGLPGMQTPPANTRIGNMQPPANMMAPQQPRLQASGLQPPQMSQQQNMPQQMGQRQPNGQQMARPQGRM